MSFTQNIHGGGRQWWSGGQASTCATNAKRRLWWRFPVVALVFVEFSRSRYSKGLALSTLTPIFLHVCHVLTSPLRHLPPPYSLSLCLSLSLSLSHSPSLSHSLSLSLSLSLTHTHTHHTHSHTHTMIQVSHCLVNRRRYLECVCVIHSHPPTIQRHTLNPTR